MNLLDYKRMAKTLFGDSEELQKFLEQVWDSAVRSGAASSATTKLGKVTVLEWDWSAGTILPIVQYVQRECPVELDQRDAALFVKSNLEAMQLWAESNGVRKQDWTAALKGWMRKEWATSLPASTQRNLFGQQSAPQLSPSAKAEDDHNAVLQAAIDLNSPKGPHSPCNTLLDSASARILPESPSSSRTPRRSH